ncbi:MAG: hypothetical protein V7L01_17785 [Nostoc sp.]|uniref:hypothetical protein n=1 Tax=Nostoc sp. TaxID=1180 RepID=UPI002FFA7CEF
MMNESIDILKADSVEKILNQYWFPRKILVYQVFPHLSLGICSLQEQQGIILLYLKIGFVTSYVNNFSKTLNKYVAASNVFDCSISYIDIVSNLIVRNSESYFASMYNV